MAKEGEEKASHLTSEAIKTYLDVMEKGEPKLTAENVARNLAKVVYDSMAEFYAADVERGKKVREEFIACGSGPPRGT